LIVVDYFSNRSSRMNKGKLIAGILFLGLALILYSSGYTQFTYSLSEEILSEIRIYPAASLALLGMVFVGNEMLRDMRARVL